MTVVDLNGHVPARIDYIGTSTVPTYFAACAEYEVKVGGLDALRAHLAVSSTPGSKRGVVIIFQGGEGTDWWSDSLPGSSSFVSDLVADGLQVFQVKWGSSWMDAPSGQQYGMRRVAARVATVIESIRSQYVGGSDVLYLLGTSNGATQVAEYLSFYGGADVVDGAVLASGPVVQIQRGCSGLGGDSAYSAVGSSQAGYLDDSFGEATTGGNCYIGAGTSMQTLYDDTDLLTSAKSNLGWHTSQGGNLGFVTFLQGSLDSGPLVTAIKDLVAAMPKAGREWLEVEGAAHTVQASAVGETAIKRALLRRPQTINLSAPVSAMPGTSVVATMNNKIGSAEIANSGTLLIADFWAATPPANWTIPSGWTLIATKQGGGGGSRYLGKYYRITDGTEDAADLTFGTTVSVNQGLVITEAGSFTGTPTLDVSGSNNGSSTSPSVTSGTTTDTPEYAHTSVISGGGAPTWSGSWTNSFVPIYADTTKITAAERLVTTASGTSVSTTTGLSGSQQWAAVGATFNS